MKAYEINSGIKELVQKDFKSLLPYFDALIEESWKIIDEASSMNVELFGMSIVMLCHYQLEMIHSCKVQFENACFRPSYLQIRSILEAFFYVRYIVQKDSKNRSLAYLNEYYKETSRFASKLDVSNLVLSDIESAALKSLIANQDMFKSVAKERKRKKVKHWYSLFDGPINFELLVQQLHEEKSIFYAEYVRLSQTTHATDLSQRMEIFNRVQNNIAIQLPWTLKEPAEYLTLLVSVFKCHAASLCELLIFHKHKDTESRKVYLGKLSNELRVKRDECLSKMK